MSDEKIVLFEAAKHKRHNAAEVDAEACGKRRPELVIDPGDLPATARSLRDLLAASGRLFDRGVPVRIIRSPDGGPPLARPLTANNVVVEAHGMCQPVRVSADGERLPVTLSQRLARMYLDQAGEWHLPPLVGVSTAPLLFADGSVRVADGYDPETGLLCCGVPTQRLAATPSRGDAEAALRRLRQAFRTFPFADAAICRDASLGVEVVDGDMPPGRDETAFLIALLTAVCRPSLWLAPGMLFTAPAVSGAGSGKGLLVRAICAIAFGIRPRAFTAGGELDKRLAAELTEAQPALFLDNLNATALRSALLASVLTERPVGVRVLGIMRMATLNSTAFVAVADNGLTVTEDLTRRFIHCELDPRCENPESRPFPAGFLDGIEHRRADLLTAVLTIWRWGRQNAADLTPGKPLGSYATWTQWCRDPLLTLGCCDPVERIEEVKARDPQRQQIAELFVAWREHYGSAPVTAHELAEPVKAIADPQRRGRQYLAAFLQNLAGTRAVGFVLTRQEPVGKWGAATYRLEPTMPPPAQKPQQAPFGHHRA
jgi:hypothetical protein